MSKPGSKEYYSAWRAFKSILPGMEVSNEKDFEDFLNQKRSYTEAFIKWLENEYTSPNLALTYKTHIFENKSGKPGWYPAPATEPRIFTSLALKQSAIKTDLGNILEHLNTAAKNAPEQGVDWLSTSLTW